MLSEKSYKMQRSDVALLIFALCNAVRLAGYVPQMVKIVKDANGAQAVSCATWALFAAANISTVVYAWTILQDALIVTVFSANAACCFAIITLTLVKRRRRACLDRPFSRTSLFESSRPPSPASA